MSQVTSHQVINLMDTVAVLQRVIYVNDVANLTITSKVGTKIVYSAISPDAAGPYMSFSNGKGITFSKVSIGPLRMNQTPLFFDHSTVILEDFECVGAVLEPSNTSPLSHAGGCLYARYGQTRIIRGNFTGNSLSSQFGGVETCGGAVAIAIGTLYVVDSHFIANEVVSDEAIGGAICAITGSVHAFNTTFRNNRVSGISSALGGALHVSGGDLDLTSCPFINNTATAQDPSAYAGGGAVYQVARPSSAQPFPLYASVADCTFRANTLQGLSDLDGGAMVIQARSAVIRNSNFTANLVGMLLTYGAAITSRGSLAAHGGALKVISREIVVSDCFFGWNHVGAPSGYAPGWAFGGAAELVSEQHIRRKLNGVSSIRVIRNVWIFNSATGGYSVEDNTGGAAYGGALRIVGFDAAVSVFNNSFNLNTGTGGDGPASGGIAAGAALSINNLISELIPKPIIIPDWPPIPPHASPPSSMFDPTITISKSSTEERTKQHFVWSRNAPRRLEESLLRSSRDTLFQQRHRTGQQITDHSRQYDSFLRAEAELRRSRQRFKSSIDEEDWSIESHFTESSTLLSKKRHGPSSKGGDKFSLPKDLHTLTMARQAERKLREIQHHRHLFKDLDHESRKLGSPESRYRYREPSAPTIETVPTSSNSSAHSNSKPGFEPSPTSINPAMYSVDIFNNTFAQNAIIGGAGDMIGGDATGGAVYYEGSYVRIYGCTFHINVAMGGNTQLSPMGANTGGYGRGGALYVHQQSGIVKVVDSIFSVNQASGGQGYVSSTPIPPLQYGRGGMAFGGAVSVWTQLPEGDTHSVSFEYCEFQDNHAMGGSAYLNPGEGVGGAIWGNRLSTFRVAFAANEASNGGAIYAVEYRGTNTTFILNNAKVLTPSAALGGAVSTFNATLIQSKFRENKAVTLEESASSMGGAVHSESDLTVKRCSFYGNSVLAFATTARGGAIAALNYTDVQDSHFEANVAATMDLGTAVGLGGSIYMMVEEGGFSTLRNVCITSNFANFGGGIYVHGLNAAERDWRNIQVVGNRANDAGGGIALLPHLWNRGIITTTNNRAGSPSKRDFEEDSEPTLPSSPRGTDEPVSADAPLSGDAPHAVSVPHDANAPMRLVPPRNITIPGPIKVEVCKHCTVANNSAGDYGPNLIMPYMSIMGITTSSVNPGLPFFANFTVLDWAENTVKSRGLLLSVSSDKDTLFQSGSWQNLAQLNHESGVASFSDMTAWGAPTETFQLNFTLGNYSADFGTEGHIALNITYGFDPCPAGYRLDSTSAYTACQHCLAGAYGFDSNCTTCPDGLYCAHILDDRTSTYMIGDGFQPSPRLNPVAILACPYRLGTLGDADLKSSCSPTICTTDCGPSRTVHGTAFSADDHVRHGALRPYHRRATLPHQSCLVNCTENNCAPGHTGFLCTKCICNSLECYYPSDNQCHKCMHSWMPTVVVFCVAVFLFVLLRGTLLALCLGILSAVVIGLTFANRISTLLSSLFGTAFIIFIEAQRGSSSGLIKSFVFFMQTVTVFITPDVLPPQMLKLASMKSVTQFHVVGLECLSPSLFGNPFQQFLFAMFLPIILMLLLYIAFWFSELLRLIPPVRMLQDFDPLDHIAFFRERFKARQRSDATYSLLHSTLQHSESEISLSGSDGGYLSGDLLNDASSDTGSQISSTSTQIARQEGLRSFLVHTNWKIGRVALFLIFAAHFELCNRILEVFAPCVHVPSEKFSYSTTLPWLVCQNAEFGFFSPRSVHGRMAIAGLIFGVIYILGVPAVFAGLLFWKRQEIKAGDNTTTQSLGLLYNSYRPSLHYFELVWLCRRVVFSAAISILPSVFVSHFIAPTVILMISLLVQRRYKPFIIKGDNNMEVISILTIMFVLSINISIGTKASASDAVVWKWVNVLVILTVTAIFVYRLFKPVLNFLRTPREE